MSTLPWLQEMTCLQPPETETMPSTVTSTTTEQRRSFAGHDTDHGTADKVKDAQEELQDDSAASETSAV